MMSIPKRLIWGTSTKQQDKEKYQSVKAMGVPSKVIFSYLINTKWKELKTIKLTMNIQRRIYYLTAAVDVII